MISEVIKILQNGNYYGAGKYTEIAKGKHELVMNWKGIKCKLKRVIKSR